MRPSLVLLLAALGVGFVACGKKSSPTEPTPVCAIALSSGSVTFGSDGGSGSVTVNATPGCGWSVTPSAGWISVTGGASGNGPGTVTYTVAANAATDSRTGSLTIGGQNHAIVQQGRSPTVCSYDVSPGSATFSKDAGTGTFTVAAPGGCSWTALSDASWLVVTSGSRGSGAGSVSFTVERNSDVEERSASVAVADRKFTVRQSGDSGSCQYSVTPVDVRPCMPGGTVAAAVTTQAFCPWTATSNASWLGPAGASGSGSGTVTITFSDNYDAPRQGMILVRWPTPTAGQNILVSQAGCRYGVSRTVFSFVAAGGTGSFDVVQESDPNTCGGATQDRCVWTAQSDVPWITITSGMPRSGDNPVAFAVAANDGAASRVGNIAVHDKVVTITQAGK